MCALLVCLLSSLLLVLLLLLVHLLAPSSPYLHASPPLPACSFHLFRSLLFLFFFIHPPPSLPHPDLPNATFPSFFSLTINLSLVHLLTSFVAFTHSSAVGRPFSSHQRTSFLRLLFSSLMPQLPLSLFLALTGVALLCCRIASRSP